MKKITLTTKIKFSPRKEASVDNPYINKVDFVLTDDQPNANMVGIKKEEFFGLANSAMFMPIKMTFGGIADGHDGAAPIGVITETIIDENAIIGSGVVWPEERPSDISYLKERVKESSAFISWELAYASEETDEAGILWLKAPVCLAATLVNRPAYEGRTPMFNFASVTDTNEDSMPEELETPEVEDVVAEEPEVVTTPEVVDANTEILAELESLRNFKLRTERGKVIRDNLGDLAEEDVNTLVGLTDAQLTVVKKLVASKKEATNQTQASVVVIEEVIPEIPIPQPKNDAQTLREFLRGDN